MAGPLPGTWRFDPYPRYQSDFALRRVDRVPKVAAWLAAQAETDLFLSLITLGEIERGIRLQVPRDPDFAGDLRHWLGRTVMVFANRLLDFTANDARTWGYLSARLGHPGADLMIAAQAPARNTAVVTGNVSDFAPAGVRLVNSF